MKRSMIGVLVFLLGGAVSSHATSIVVNPGAGLAANSAARSAFNRAAAMWGALFADPTTVTINADFTNMGSTSILGSTSSVFLQGSYDLIRNQMVADAADEISNSIVAALPTAGQVSAYVPSGFGLYNAIAATKANLKAMGFLGLDAAFGASDADMTFNSGFSWDYFNADGVTEGTWDFETVAVHEIGHVLGFVSAVDIVDYYLHQNLTDDAVFEPLDLFRFRTDDLAAAAANFTNTPRSLLPNTPASFSDTVNEWALSTGYYTGDRRQASHWKDDSLTGSYLGIMDPTLGSGIMEPITLADLRALDLIGWDAAAPVPLPPSFLLLATGLGTARLMRWRRKS